jgi:3-methyl-2-oxobutanoate hydroxymethyltransferase
MYDFGRAPAQRNYTVRDLQNLKGSGTTLSMSNPANEAELRACIDAGIDLLVVWDEQLDECRRISPTTFMGIGSTWKQFGTSDEILAHAVDLMGRGGDMYYTIRSYEVIEKLANEGIPVQSHIGLIPTFSHHAGGLRAYGRTAVEAMEIWQTIRRLEDAGCFAVEVECIAEEFLHAVNDKTSLVTFSLGSGRGGDAVFSFVADVCGEPSEEANPPKHAHAFGNVGRLHEQVHAERVEALTAFHQETSAGNFPYDSTNIAMLDGEYEKFLEAFDGVA